MAIDVVAAVLVGLLGAVTAVLFVRGVIGMFVTRDRYQTRYPW